MRNKLIATVVAALAVAGLVAGAANAGAKPSQSRTLTVVSGDTLQEQSEGLINQLREQGLNRNGARVGTIRWNCANGADWHCTLVYSLKGKGSIVATGIFAGFDGEKLAVTGGTGSFADARGQVVLSVQDDQFTHQIRLQP
jgi:hypothetical protein